MKLGAKGRPSVAMPEVGSVWARVNNADNILKNLEYKCVVSCIRFDAVFGKHVIVIVIGEGESFGLTNNWYLDGFLREFKPI